jgi:thiol-disulfide isomerase/thioredoxin
MKKYVLIAIVALLAQGYADAADKSAAVDKSAAARDLESLMSKVNAKVSEGKKTEKDLADELKQFDTLLTRHKEEKKDELAKIAYMKAIVYYQHLDNTEKASDIITKIKKDYPESPQARGADATLAVIQKEGESRKMQKSLVEGAVFPTFNEMDINGKPLGITKDKVVLVQFWAAWSDPSKDEFPYLKAAYEKYHGKGFEIVGVSVDTDKNKVITLAQNLPWPQYFDGQGWENKLAVKYGVKTIPTTYLVDGKGNIIAKDLRGPALETELAKALTK